MLEEKIFCWLTNKLKQNMCKSLKYNYNAIRVKLIKKITKGLAKCRYKITVIRSKELLILECFYLEENYCNSYMCTLFLSWNIT